MTKTQVEKGDLLIGSLPKCPKENWEQYIFYNSKNYVFLYKIVCLAERYTEMSFIQYTAFYFLTYVSNMLHNILYFVTYRYAHKWLSIVIIIFKCKI